MLSIFKKKVEAARAALNLVDAVTSIQECKQKAQMLRKPPVPDGVIIAEVAFLRASALCDAIRSVASGSHRELMQLNVAMQIVKIFDGAELDAPVDVLEHYKHKPMALVSNDAFQEYVVQGHVPMLTTSVFCRRVHGYGEMDIEMRPLIQEVVAQCEFALRSVKMV